MKLHHLAKIGIVLIVMISFAIIFFKQGDPQRFLGISFRGELIFLVVIQASILAFSLVNAIAIDHDKLSFRILSQVIFAGYSLLGPLMIIYSDDIGNIVQKIYNEDFIIRVIYLFILMQIGMVIGAYLKPINLKVLNKGISTKNLSRSGLILFCISIIPMTIMFLRGDLSLDAEYIQLYQAMQAPTIMNKVAMYANFLLLFPLSWLIIVNVQQKRKKDLIMVLLCILLLTFLKPSRGLILSMSMVAFLSYHYLVKRVTFRHICTFLLVLMVLSFSILIYRVSVGTDKWQMLSKVSEGYSIYENTLLVYDYVNTTSDYRYGVGYFDIILRLIPNSLNPFDLELPLPQWLLEEFFPKTKEIGGGRMFSIVADGYINFGYVGPLLLGVVFSYVLKHLYMSMKRSSQQKKQCSFATIIYFFVSSQMYYFFRGDLASFSLRIGAYVFIPIFALILLSVLFQRKIINCNSRHCAEITI